MSPHAFDCPEADRLVDDALRAIGAEIDALRIPRLLGVVLGGGYARGEGGVIAGGLSNDLDFYVVAEDGASGAELAAIAAALRPVSEKWTAALGVDVDFSPPKTPWRISHDAERLMIQELIHGYCDVAGKPGAELFADVPRRPPEALPFLEAVRLLVNRGAGLLLDDLEDGDGIDYLERLPTDNRLVRVAHERPSLLREDALYPLVNGLVHKKPVDDDGPHLTHPE